MPYGRHTVDEDDIAAVARTLASSLLTTGPAVAAFEDAFAGATGGRHAVVCSSGTAALHLAALALDLGPGDTVVVPTVTFLATANAARYVGADVAFADVDPDTGLMRPEDLERALAAANGAVKAVMPVHLAGQMPPLAAIAEVADDRGLAMVEDACHALGTTDATGREKAGGCAHGVMATFSFHPVKTIAMGEGGAVTTNDGGLAGRLRRLRSHGMTRAEDGFANKDMAFDRAGGGGANPWYYEMPEIGYNYRASDIHCALGLSQLGKLERFVERRQGLAARYDALLAPLAPLVRPLGRVPDCRPTWHLYIVLIDFDAAGITRGQLMGRLRARGIGTQVHYIPVHRQPYYERRYGVQDLPGAEAYYRRCLSLPLFPAMADGDVDRVVEALAAELPAA